MLESDVMTMWKLTILETSHEWLDDGELHRLLYPSRLRNNSASAFASSEIVVHVALPAYDGYGTEMAAYREDKLNRPSIDAERIGISCESTCNRGHLL